jgi:hypothetical protein
VDLACGVGVSGGVGYLVFCDVCSPKASLSQGREGEWEGKGTPELTDTDLLTGGSGGKGNANKTRWGTKGSPSVLTI